MRVGWSGWSLELSSDWEVEDDAECLTIYKRDGVGALQLSSAKKTIGEVSQEDLDFHTKPEWGAPEKCRHGEFVGQSYRFRLEGTYWQWWILGYGPVLLRASYNCDEIDSQVEIGKVVGFLNTLRREPKDA